jgi:hypothetical protein
MAKTVSGSCEERERLRQRWIEACALMEGKGAELESARAGEQGTRHLLNEHMVSHGCGFPVSAPRLDD